MNTLLERIDELRPWQQRIIIGGMTTPGMWDVESLAQFLKTEAPWPVQGRILDAGGNAGGISIELQPTADSIVCVDPDPHFADQYRFLSQHIDTGKIKYERESLFALHKQTYFDVVLMLGLFYHFRHPQMFLDYCSNLQTQRFIFSTQHIPGGGNILRNRIDIGVVTRYVKKEFNVEHIPHITMGWHPTQSAMINMLKSSGFAVDKAVCVLDSPYAANAGNFTNSLYVFCTLESPVRTNIDAISQLAACEGFWT